MTVCYYPISMPAHTDGKTNGDAARVLMLMHAVADTDTSVSPRALADAYVAAQPESLFIPGKIVEAARAATARARAAHVADRSNDANEPRLKARRTEGEKLLTLRTKDVVRQIDPWIRDRRAELFGHTDPPYRSLDEAAIWIEQEAQKQPRRPSPEREALDDEVEALLTRLLEADAWASSYGLTEKNAVLRFWKPDGFPGHVRVSRVHPTLYGVCRAAEHIAEVTTLPPATAVAWLLAGIHPGQRVRLSDRRTATMPGLRLVSWHVRELVSSAPHGDPHVTHRTRLVFDLDVRDLTDRNLRVAVREATKHLTRGAPTLTAKQQRVLTLVERLGGPPTPKFARPFWTRVAKGLRLEDPIAVAKRYYRAVQASRPDALQPIATDSKTARVKAPQVPPVRRKNARQSPRGTKRA